MVKERDILLIGAGLLGLALLSRRSQAQPDNNLFCFPDGTIECLECPDTTTTEAP